MAFDQKTFWIRATSAILFAGVMFAGIVYNSWSFFALFALVQFLGLQEYVKLLQHIFKVRYRQKDKFALYIAGWCAYTFVALLPVKACAFSYGLFELPMLFYFLGILLGMSAMLFISQDKKARFLLSGIGYVAIPLALLHHLRLQSLMIPLFLIFTIWINDTMAYLGGSFFGKRPLAITISPKKTIEGTMIGVLFTLIFAFIWSRQFPFYRLVDYSVLALIGSIIGTAGDLIESQLKRWAGVKDSGNILPGHGGVLDRFDSLIFSSSFAFVYAILFMDCQAFSF